jgi:hypothetical protein
MLVRFSTIHAAALLMAAAIVITWAEPAYAYIDPGAGSAIASAIVGIVAAAGYAFRSVLFKARRLLAGTRTDEDGRKSKNP